MISTCVSCGLRPPSRVMERNRLPDQIEQVELLAQRIWSEWLTLGDTMRIAERFGYPKN